MKNKNITSLVLLDNTFYGQNQDYIPSRYACQVEFTYLLSNKYLEKPLNTLGVIPICQPTPNYILTPTKDKKFITKFFDSLKLCEIANIDQAIDLCLAISQKTLLDRPGNNFVNIYFFMASPTEFTDKIKKLLDEVEKYDINLEIFLMGEAIEIKNKLEGNFSNSKVRVLNTSDEILDNTPYLNDNSVLDDDDLALKAAIELSKREY